MSGTVLIAGAGLAGSRCAEALRDRGWTGRIVLAGAEPHAPYERPALSKALLAGERDELALRPAAWWDERGIELRLRSPVAYVDVDRRTARVAGEEIRWQHLVLATGAEARRPFATAGLHHLRTVDDARRLRDALSEQTRLVVVGAGFIGGEVASTALGRVASVTLVDPFALPLERVVGPEVGRLLAARYRRAGVELRLGVGVERVERRERELRLELADGSSLAADVVLVAVGVVPRSPHGEGAVKVDACGRTERDGVWACGDVASWAHPLAGGAHVRLEHWTSADGQARAVGSAIAGDPQPWLAPPYFWSDQFGLRLQHVGLAHEWASVELDGDEDSFAARYLDASGRLRAALLANRPQETAAVRRAIGQEVSV
jgi:3-phenylpropionate/trans-cinnamate dioxygenase ferredoxin reductase subunit